MKLLICGHFWPTQTISYDLILFLSCYVQLFATPWTVAHQASLPVTISWSSPKLMSVELMMLFSHLILCHPLRLMPSVFSASGSFPMSWLFTSGGQSIGASASASVLPTNIQGWFPLELTGLISLLSKGLARVFSSTVWKHQLLGTFFMVQLSNICTWLLEKPIWKLKMMY